MVNDETPALPDESAEETQPRRRLWWLWLLLAIVALLSVAGMSAYSGYQSGIQERQGLEATQVAGQCESQFDLGVRDYAGGQYEIAQQRFEYVIRLCPSYPEVTEMLANTLLALNITATPTIVPTVTLTPTPDLRDEEELFDQAQLLLSEKQWESAIEVLNTLRQKDPEYRAIELDGMYFVALRNLGIEKIERGNLEGGTYDLSRAERFGPLDREAEAWREWAGLYVTAASFWDINWSQAVFYFSQLTLAAPNLRDLSGWTAIDRLRVALIRYGDQFADAEEWCAAMEQYDQAFAISVDPAVEPTATQIAQNCLEPTEKPQKKETETPEPTPTEDVGQGATPTPTPEGAQEPTSTPEPTAEPPPEDTPTATQPPPSATPTPEPPTQAPTEPPTEPPTEAPSEVPTETPAAYP